MTHNRLAPDADSGKIPKPWAKWTTILSWGPVAWEHLA